MKAASPHRLRLEHATEQTSKESLKTKDRHIGHSHPSGPPPKAVSLRQGTLGPHDGRHLRPSPEKTSEAMRAMVSHHLKSSPMPTTK